MFDKFRSLISDFLNDEDYFLSYLDIYIISKKFDLPIILLCNSVINNVISKEKYIMLNKNPENNLYYFIKIPSQYLKGQKNYKLLHFENSIMIDIDKDLNNSAEYEFENKILERVKNFEDLIFNAIKLYNNKVMEKNRKFERKRGGFMREIL